jgi:hypothetical protein
VKGPRNVCLHGKAIISNERRITSENIISHENVRYARDYELRQAYDASHEGVRGQKMSDKKCGRHNGMTQT